MSAEKPIDNQETLPHEGFNELTEGEKMVEAAKALLENAENLSLDQLKVGRKKLKGYLTSTRNNISKDSESNIRLIIDKLKSAKNKMNNIIEKEENKDVYELKKKTEPSKALEIVNTENKEVVNPKAAEVKSDNIKLNKIINIYKRIIKVQKRVNNKSHTVKDSTKEIQIAKKLADSEKIRLIEMVNLIESSNLTDKDSKVLNMIKASIDNYPEQYMSLEEEIDTTFEKKLLGKRVTEENVSKKNKPKIKYHTSQINETPSVSGEGENSVIMETPEIKIAGAVKAMDLEETKLTLEEVNKFIKRLEGFRNRRKKGRNNPESAEYIDYRNLLKAHLVKLQVNKVEKNDEEEEKTAVEFSDLIGEIVEKIESDENEQAETLILAYGIKNKIEKYEDSRDHIKEFNRARELHEMNQRDEASNLSENAKEIADEIIVERNLGDNVKKVLDFMNVAQKALGDKIKEKIKEKNITEEQIQTLIDLFNSEKKEDQDIRLKTLDIFRKKLEISLDEIGNKKFIELLLKMAKDKSAENSEKPTNKQEEPAEDDEEKAIEEKICSILEKLSPEEIEKIIEILKSGESDNKTAIIDKLAETYGVTLNNNVEIKNFIETVRKIMAEQNGEKEIVDQITGEQIPAVADIRNKRVESLREGQQRILQERLDALDVNDKLKEAREYLSNKTKEREKFLESDGMKDIVARAEKSELLTDDEIRKYKTYRGLEHAERQAMLKDALAYALHVSSVDPTGIHEVAAEAKSKAGRDMLQCYQSIKELIEDRNRILQECDPKTKTSVNRLKDAIKNEAGKDKLESVYIEYDNIKTFKEFQNNLPRLEKELKKAAGKFPGLLSDKKRKANKIFISLNKFFDSISENPTEEEYTSDLAEMKIIVASHRNNIREKDNDFANMANAILDVFDELIDGNGTRKIPIEEPTPSQNIDNSKNSQGGSNSTATDNAGTPEPEPISESQDDNSEYLKQLIEANRSKDDFIDFIETLKYISNKENIISASKLSEGSTIKDAINENFFTVKEFRDNLGIDLDDTIYQKYNGMKIVDFAKNIVTLYEKVKLNDNNTQENHTNENSKKKEELQTKIVDSTNKLMNSQNIDGITKILNDLRQEVNANADSFFAGAMRMMQDSLFYLNLKRTEAFERQINRVKKYQSENYDLHSNEYKFIDAFLKKAGHLEENTEQTNDNKKENEVNKGEGKNETKGEDAKFKKSVAETLHLGDGNHKEECMKIKKEMGASDSKYQIFLKVMEDEIKNANSENELVSIYKNGFDIYASFGSSKHTIKMINTSKGFHFKEIRKETADKIELLSKTNKGLGDELLKKIHLFFNIEHFPSAEETIKELKK